MSDQESFISHLVELRQRLVRAVAAVGVLFVVFGFAWPGAGAIYDFLAVPLMSALPQGAKMIATGVITPFMVPVKVAALAAFVVALPLIVASTVLFLLGMAFCYYIVFERVFSFIHTFAPASITPAPDIDAYFSFVLTMFLAFGITFEIPIVVIVLVRMGLVTVEKLRDARPYVVVGAFVVAAVVTPPDVLSQFMLAVPMCLLYEAGLFLARFVAARPKTESEYKTQP